MIVQNQFKAKGFLVWGICTLFFLYEFFLRTVMGTYQHPIMSDLNLTTFQFSFISTTVFLVIYGAVQIPIGLIVDNIGLKKSLLIGTITCGIAAAGFAYSYHFPVAVFFRLLMGFGASFGFIGVLVALYDWMPHRYLAIFIGISQFIGTMGPMLAAGPLDTLSETKGLYWRDLFLSMGAFGLGLALLVLLFVENNLKKSGHFTILYRSEKITTSLMRLLSKWQPWAIAVFSATIYFAIEYLSENEGRTFLSFKGISFNAASYMITIAWIGYAISCPLLGFISDMLQRRKHVTQICALMGFVAIITILYAQNKLWLQVAFFLLGASAAGQSVAYAMISEQFKKQFVAVGFALNNAVILLFAAINAPLIGLFLDYKGRLTQITLAEYTSVFNILVFISAISIIIAFFFIKETFCKSTAEYTYLNYKKTV